MRNPFLTSPIIKKQIVFDKKWIPPHVLHWLNRLPRVTSYRHGQWCVRAYFGGQSLRQRGCAATKSHCQRRRLSFSLAYLTFYLLFIVGLSEDNFNLWFVHHQVINARHQLSSRCVWTRLFKPSSQRSVIRLIFASDLSGRGSPSFSCDHSHIWPLYALSQNLWVKGFDYWWSCLHHACTQIFGAAAPFQITFVFGLACGAQLAVDANVALSSCQYSTRWLRKHLSANPIWI